LKKVGVDLKNDVTIKSVIEGLKDLKRAM
jgi:hypothetical protein